MTADNENCGYRTFIQIKGTAEGIEGRTVKRAGAKGIYNSRVQQKEMKADNKNSGYRTDIQIKITAEGIT